MANLKPGPETALAFNRLIEAQGLLTAQNNTDAILKTIGSTDSRLATAVQRSIQLDLALRVTQSLAPSFLNKGVLDCDGLLAAVQGAVDTLSDFVFQTATIAAVADLWNEGAELVYSPDSTALPETPPTGWVEDPCLPEE